MLKYILSLPDEAIKNYLSNCSLMPVSFGDSPAIKRTKNKILITCIKSDSLFFKTILDWNDKKNKFGDLRLSFVDKDDFENFITISINDFYVKILNKNKYLSKINADNDLSIKLNYNYLKLMMTNFQDTKYCSELKKYNTCANLNSSI